MTIVLALTAIVGAAVFLYQYLFDRDLRMLEPGMQTCSIIGCDAILRGPGYVWTRGLREDRVCLACGEELSATWPSLVLRREC